MNAREESRNQYLKELSLRLRAEGIQSEPSDVRTLRVYQDGQPVCDVAYSGDVYRDIKYPDIPEADMLYQRTAEISGTVKEYMKAMENAPPVPAKGLDPADGYRQLTEFNGVVLAGQRTEYGCRFVTWRWDQQHEHVDTGRYFAGDYEGAKQDFVLRSDLMNRERLFSNGQMVEIYRCVQETLDSGYDLTLERRRALEGITEQIEHGVPNLDGLVNQSNEDEIKMSM